MSLLDRLAPGPALRASGSREIAAAPPRVFRAIGEVTIDDLAAAGLGAAAGRVVRRLRSRRSRDDEPLFAQVLREGFGVLGSDPLREIVLGRGARAALVAGVLCEPVEGGSHVRVEVRARPAAFLPLLALAPLWGSARRRAAEPLIEAWLDAVGRRAEG